MARMRMVTRTVEVINVEVMAINTETAEVTRPVYTVTGVADSAIEKAVRKLYETDTVKIVKILSTSRTECLYGMPEDEFIKLAKVLPPRAVTE